MDETPQMHRQNGERAQKPCSPRKWMMSQNASSCKMAPVDARPGDEATMKAQIARIHSKSMKMHRYHDEWSKSSKFFKSAKS
jgi:hypothetical protein